MKPAETNHVDDDLDTKPFAKEVPSCVSETAPSSTPATSHHAGVLAGLRELRDTQLVECRYAPNFMSAEDWPGIDELFDYGGES